MWKESSRRENQPARWRFSLEETRTGERRGFADIEQLFAYLKARMEKDDSPL